MTGTHADRKIMVKANQLYWGSDLSVNQIAEELDLSKGALYGMVLPDKSGAWCPDCGADAGFENRTAKDRGHLTCRECGWEGDLDDAEDYGTGGAVTLPEIDEDDIVEEEESVTVAGKSRTRIAAGGALLGAAAGLALVLWARRR